MSHRMDSKQKYTAGRGHQHADWEREDAINIRLNLGADSPDSVLRDDFNYNQKYAGDDWTRSGLAVYTNVPERPRTWRSNSFGEKQKKRPSVSVPVSPVEDRDCGICFMNSVSPSQTLCCGKFFCYEHIASWLTGPAADGRCPECMTPCSLEHNVHFYDLGEPQYSVPPPTPVINQNHRHTSTSTSTATVRLAPSTPAAMPAPQIRQPTNPSVNSIPKAAEKKSDRDYQKMLGVVGFAMAVGYRATSQGFRL
ncbi:hypothetical protein VNI00_006830 [Paramarasmius palmivorus]|uniref:RING-type domain-containing protein n=1 Tax=Paramarasmius palmivorus TaxID=297713 RepID=A0AAW0D852_9AGAR